MNSQQTWIKFGMILGLVTIALSILFFYLVDIGLFKQSIFMYGAMILIMVLAGLDYRTSHDNAMLYGEAFKVTFLTGMIGMVVSTLFTFILMNYIDPELIDILVEKTINSTESLMRSMGAPEDQVDEALAKLETDMPAQFTMSGIARNLITVAIVSAILAAIVSIFLRKEETPV